MSSINLKTINFSNSEIGSKSVNLTVNLDIESAKSVAYVVRWQLASRRSGSAKVKSMSEISGTTAKPHKQKGTGRARQGSRRSVQFVGGRTCHGPTPRSFDFSMPKKIVKIALSDAVKFRLKEDKIVLFSDFGSEVKTAKVNAILNSNNFSNALIIHDGSNPALVKSAKNLKNVKTLRGEALNVYDLLSFDHILVDDKIFESKILGAAL
jgi:large subunit ribosomal protein L4